MNLRAEATMHLVRYHVAVSFDGFIAPKDGSADWLNPYGKVAMDFMASWMKQIGGVISGRATYDQAIGMGGAWGKTPAVVMTSRPLARASKTVITANDEAEGLAQLKARMAIESRTGGDIWLFGGGVTAGRFLKAGLIDLVELAVVPVMLGEGRPLFASGPAQITFEHTGSQSLGSGCVLNSYRKIPATAPARAHRSRSR
jgi:dihydrofolate reductase